MKVVAASLLVCLTPFTALAATPVSVQFQGAISQDDATPTVVDLQLPSTQAATLQVADGFRLELVTPGNSASPEGARVRLVAANGKVLHTATVPDVGIASLSFAYRVCGRQVTYISPQPAAVPKCGS